MDSSICGYFIEAANVRRVKDSIPELSAFDRRVPDHESVNELMKRLKDMPESPVLLYRPATTRQKLLIVLQTASMREAMEHHGKHVLACDTTHDTSRYPSVCSYFAVFGGVTGDLLCRYPTWYRDDHRCSRRRTAGAFLPGRCRIDSRAVAGLRSARQTVMRLVYDHLKLWLSSDSQNFALDSL